MDAITDLRDGLAPSNPKETKAWIVPVTGDFGATFVGEHSDTKAWKGRVIDNYGVNPYAGAPQRTKAANIAILLPYMNKADNIGTGNKTPASLAEAVIPSPKDKAADGRRKIDGLLRLANEGCAEAQFFYAHYCLKTNEKMDNDERGQRKERKPIQNALYWLNEAAKRGVSEAHLSFAELHSYDNESGSHGTTDQSRILPRDLAKAADHLCAAASLGNVEGLYRYAQAHVNGRGVEKNLPLGIMMLIVANQCNYRPAKSALEKAISTEEKLERDEARMLQRSERNGLFARLLGRRSKSHSPTTSA
jgi:TPR repeat protein